MNEATLLYLVREGRYGLEVCLARKKRKRRSRRNYVASRLNAAGGHVEENDKTPAEAAVRELLAEQGVIVSPDKLEPVAILYFLFPGHEYPDLRCYAFVAREWRGEPQVTKEMGKPYWFRVRRLPFKRLPDADPFWLKAALEGEALTGTFELDGNYSVITHSVCPSSLALPFGPV